MVQKKLHPRPHSGFRFRLELAQSQQLGRVQLKRPIVSTLEFLFIVEFSHIRRLQRVKEKTMRG